MNDYGFDYMNYITNIPSSMKYDQTKTNVNFSMDKQNMNKMVPDTMNNMMNNMIKKDQPIDPMDGWKKGNLFSNLYEPYKNYKPAKVEPNNERDALLYQVMQYKFALVELNLYLDTHPNDMEMVKLYNKYLDIEKKMCEKYESMYGPLTLSSDNLDKNNWTWINSPWPWEVK